MGVANSDAKLYDEELQTLAAAYPDQFRLDYALSREQKVGGRMRGRGLGRLVGCVAVVDVQERGGDGAPAPPQLRARPVIFRRCRERGKRSSPSCQPAQQPQPPPACLPNHPHHCLRFPPLLLPITCLQNVRGGKMYIQDKVEEYSDEVFDLLNNGAHMYFCGACRSRPWRGMGLLTGALRGAVRLCYPAMGAAGRGA